MTKFKNDVAYDEQVFEKALEILKKEGIETNIPQIKRVYDITAKYTKGAFKKEPYTSIWLGAMGKAYYHIYDAGKIKSQKENQYRYYDYKKEETKARVKEEFEVWKKRKEIIIEDYELFRPKENVSKDYMFYHIIQNLRRAIKRRKITSQEVEQIQNNIK